METVGPAAGTVCGVCCAALARYTCPRCGTQTCGLPCYRAHKTTCGRDAPPADPPAESEKKEGDEKEEEEEEEEDNTEQLCALLERLDGSSSDSAAVLSDAQAERLAQRALTPAQQRALARDLQSGALLRAAVGAWVPWWLAAAVDDDESSPPPPGIAPVPAAAVRRASPRVRTSLVALLAAYALLQRYLCGDWACAADAWDAARGAVALLDTGVGTHVPAPTEAAALAQLRAAYVAAAPECFGGNGAWLFAAAVRDAGLLLQTGAHAARALHELAALLARAARMRDFPEAAAAHALAHRACFHAAWVRAQGAAVLVAVRHAVDACADALENASSGGGTSGAATAPPPRILIEEVSPPDEKETIGD